MKIGIPPSSYSASFELQGYFPFTIDLHLGIDNQKVIKVTLHKIPLKIEDDKNLTEAVKLYQQGKYQAAIDSFKKLIDEFPKNPAVYSNLGIAYLRNNDIDQAIVFLNKAIDLKPDSAQAFLALGECYLRKNDQEKAIEAFERALTIQPEDARAQYDLGLIFYKNNRMEEAIVAFENAIKWGPKLSSAFY